MNQRCRDYDGTDKGIVDENEMHLWLLCLAVVLPELGSSFLGGTNNLEKGTGILCKYACFC